MLEPSVSWPGWWLLCDPSLSNKFMFVHSSLCVLHHRLKEKKYTLFDCSQTKSLLYISYFNCPNGNNYRRQTQKHGEITYYSLSCLYCNSLCGMEYPHCQFHSVHPYSSFTIHCQGLPQKINSFQCVSHTICEHF